MVFNSKNQIVDYDMDEEFSSESDIAPEDDKSWKPASSSDETETISESEEEVDENNNKTKRNSTGLVLMNTRCGRVVTDFISYPKFGQSSMS